MTKLQKLYGLSLILILSLITWLILTGGDLNSLIYGAIFAIALVFHLAGAPKVAVMITIPATLLATFIIIAFIFASSFFVGGMTPSSLMGTASISIPPILFIVLSVKVWKQATLIENTDQ